MGPACSKPPGDIATAAGVAQLPKIHDGAVLDAWCGGQDEVEFWLDGAARARTPRVPEPPPEGAWFWGDS